MTIHRVRISTIYVLITLNLVMLVCLVAVSLYVAHLHSDVDKSRDASRASCVRGNVLRDNTRFNTGMLASLARFVADNSPDQDFVKRFRDAEEELNRRSKLQLIQLQPCDLLFPE